MSTDPDQIREDIERTRAELSSDVDALTDKVSPAQVAQRQADKVRSAVTDVKDTRHGRRRPTAPTSRGSGGARLGWAAVRRRRRRVGLPARRQVQGPRQSAGRRPDRVRRRVALSSLLPSTRQEQQLAQSAKEQAAPLVQGAKDAAQDVAREPA